MKSPVPTPLTDSLKVTVQSTLAAAVGSASARTIEETFGAEQLARWQRHPWPGNVRELRNAVESAMVIGTSPELVAAVSSAEIAPYKEARAVEVGAFERDYLAKLMAAADGNVSRAARIAKMDRSHLIDLLHRHGFKD